MNVKKMIGGLLVVSSMLLGGAVIAQPAYDGTIVSQNVPVQISIAPVCGLAIDEGAQFNIDANYELIHNRSVSNFSDTINFRAGANFPWQVTAAVSSLPAGYDTNEFAFNYTGSTGAAFSGTLTDFYTNFTTTAQAGTATLVYTPNKLYSELAPTAPNGLVVLTIAAQPVD